MQKAEAIKELNSEYEKQGNQIVVLYGREGCEKEICIRRFLEGKECFYYRAIEISDAEQEKCFAERIDSRYHLDPEERDYELYAEKMKSSDGSKLVVVIDEFEHLIRKNSVFIDHMMKLKKNANGSVMILLCSSSLVFVEHKMSSTLGKLMHQIDHIYKLTELNFIDIVRIFPDNSISDCVEIFGVIGGIPAYLKHWNPKKSVKENICKHILSPGGSLFLEAERYLRMELRELSVYNTILTALAADYQKLNDLHKYTGFSRAKISVYIKNLMEFEVIEKVVSFETGGWENARKGMYQIKNTFIHFWFKFVYPNLSDLYMDTPQAFYERYMEGRLEKYLNRYFVQVCMEYMNLMNKAGRLPIQISKTGTWVGKNGTIDIIAQNSVRENIIGLCNWSEEEMTYESYQKLEDLLKEAHIHAGHYFFFSGKAFEPDLVQMARSDKRFTLIDMTDL